MSQGFFRENIPRTDTPVRFSYRRRVPFSERTHLSLFVSTGSSDDTITSSVTCSPVDHRLQVTDRLDLRREITLSWYYGSRTDLS